MTAFTRSSFADSPGLPPHCSFSTFQRPAAYAWNVSLPETIPARYTEEEAGYVTIRPVVRQTFRLHELLGMILSVTGKETHRIQKILRSGTVVYHFYRYWWEGFEAGEADLASALAEFPDAAPSRPFSPDECVTVIFESGGPHPRNLLELERGAASGRRMFRGQSFWESLVEIVGNENPVYHSYSYAHRGDLYRFELGRESALQIARAAKHYAPRNVLASLHILSEAAMILLVCPRGGTESSRLSH